MRLAGIELYFEDLEVAKRYYRDELGLELRAEEVGHYAQFHLGGVFLCLERKGSETYPSQDKAVMFLEVADVGATVERIGSAHVIQLGPQDQHGRPAWAVLHDPEGHNVLLLQAEAR